MKIMKDKCNIAVIQATPAMFDKETCLRKTIAYIDKASQNGADLIVFPELFIPGYPYGMTFGFSVGKRTEEGREDWKRYYDNSIIVPGEETRQIGDVAKKTGTFVSIGVSERDAVNATLYNSNLIFGPSGELVAVHRKLKPTGAERVVWGDANKDYFPIADTPWGPMGSMICWESYMPLARVALYQKGITLYISPNTNDNEEWQATIRHIALEGRCFFINCDMFFTKDAYPKDLHCPQEIELLPDIICRGGSCIVDPYGHYVTEPVWDRETVIYAELDMENVPKSRMEFDVCGHYSRPDILNLNVSD